MLSEKEFKRGFIQRTREARASAGLTGTEMARRLGLNQDTYKNYETNRILPPYYINPFCAICGIEVRDLYELPLRFRDRAEARKQRQAKG